MSNEYYDGPPELAPGTKARSVDINQLSQRVDAAFDKVPDEVALKGGTVNYAVNTGTTGSAYKVQLASAISAYKDGLEVKMRPVKDNTGACTLNVNGIGNIAVKRADGTDPQAGDILGGAPITLIYQATGNVFRLPAVVNSQIIQAAGASASASASAAAAAVSAATALKTLAIESDDPPADPAEGQEWIDAATARRFTFIEGQWAETYASQVTDQPTLVDALSDALQLADYAGLRAYTGPRKSVYVTGYLVASAPLGIAGMFVRDDSDVTSADNGGTIIVSANGKRWKRQHSGANIRMFGAKVDGATDDTASIQKALNAIAGGILELGPGVAICTGLAVPDGTTIMGSGQKSSTLRLKAGAGKDLIKPAGATGAGVTIQGVALDGNGAGKTLNFSTNPATDGPALTLRDVVLTAGAPDAAGASAFVGGLCWVHFDNVRFIGNDGTLWLSTNDSTYLSLYVGNSGVARNVPGVVLGGANNQFMGCYFGGNGEATGSTAPQVRLMGASANWFIACINDHANGAGYELVDYGTSSDNNQFIGGQVTNPSQNADNAYCHILFSGGAKFNKVIGVWFDNIAGIPKRGSLGVAEIGAAGKNLVQACTFGTFGSQAVAMAASSRVADCQGVPVGVIPFNILSGPTPFTWTNDQGRQVAVYLSGAGIQSIYKDGFPIYGATTNATVVLDPNEKLTMNFTGNPNVFVDRK